MPAMNQPSVQLENVADYLLANKCPDSVALLVAENHYTYGNLEGAIAMIVLFLLRLGARKGDPVLLIGDNSFFWVTSYLAALRQGLVAVPLPPTVPPADLKTVLATTDARIALVQSSNNATRRLSFPGCHVLTDQPGPPMRDVASQRSVTELPAPPATGEHSTPLTQRDDLAALMFTSGSTGKPRAVMVSHGNIISNTESIVEYLGLTANDRIMGVLPFHYCFGASLLHTHLLVGGSLVLEPRFTYPEVVLRRMIDTKCTGFAGVPSHYQILLRTSALAGKSFPHLRYVQQAGGPLAPSLIRKLQEALPDTRVFIMYGQTEATARLSYLPPEMLQAKLGSVGKGIPGVRLKVVDDAGNEVCPGQVGEIVAEGDNVALGYWQAPDETAAAFRSGQLHTGDLATVDEDGYLYIVDRARDFLKCGGRRVSRVEVHNKILEFPCVLDLSIDVIQDEVLGEALKLAVVPRMPGCGEFQSCLHRFCREHLGQELCPKEIITVDRLPSNGTGKVAKWAFGLGKQRIECIPEYFRCREDYIRLTPRKASPEDAGYFRFGDHLCFGQSDLFSRSKSPNGPSHDAAQDTQIDDGTAILSFNPDEVAANLRCERYHRDPACNQSALNSGINRLYYLLRPLLPVGVRKHLQRIRLRDWPAISFPRWPVDTTIDDLMHDLLLLSMRASGVNRIPFIWFWPHSAPCCAMMTHDVETVRGRDFCSALMDTDEAFGIKASFQVVPEQRYPVSSDFLQSITTRGFEVNVQDLNHDGKLYRNHEQFLARAAKINAYGRDWRAQGFRSAILYRKPEWFDALDFSYDLSIPNVAHLDPQRGGCCTVMPYFIGRILELPLTTTQDYSSFHILKNYSIDLWKQQSELILRKNGLLSFIFHPDYVIGSRERRVYELLLQYLASLRDEKGVWIALPGDINRWWRQRAAMRLVEEHGEVRIEGPGSELAQVAYATERNGKLVFTLTDKEGRARQAVSTLRLDPVERP